MTRERTIINFTNIFTDIFNFLLIKYHCYNTGAINTWHHLVVLQGTSRLQLLHRKQGCSQINDWFIILFTSSINLFYFLNNIITYIMNVIIVRKEEKQLKMDIGDL